jgi:haloalkane dehalogenase
MSELARLPLLVCWGMLDFVFDDAFLAEWRRRAPDAEIHTFPDAGHFLLEDAGEQVIPVVKSFLDRHPVAPSTP